ncbi:MAG: hypothetical protein FD189_1112 [Elusimicrobia bacterium]|nr:MAG: hypothetical protein FD189_1112 [Elusimicrobiota bacterium]
MILDLAFLAVGAALFGLWLVLPALAGGRG